MANNPDHQKTQDAVIEMAKDLLMLDFVPMLDGLDAAETGKSAAMPVRFASRGKTQAFRRLVVALHGARSAAEDFRQAHLDEEKASLRANMDRQFQERLTEIAIQELEGPSEGTLSPEDIERLRAS